MNDGENPNNPNNTGGEVLAPWDPMNATGPNNLDPAQAAAWRERERRQRTIRLLMMFLLMLLLMDSEEAAGRKRNETRQKLREREQRKSRHLSTEVFGARAAQERRLQRLTQQHPRYASLTEKNHGKDVPMEVFSWAGQHAEMVKDEFVGNPDSKEVPQEEKKDPEDKNEFFHYPWNATGFYRGEWIREGATKEEEEVEDATAATAKETKATTAPETGESSKEEAVAKNSIPVQYVDTEPLETEMRQAMKKREEQIGVALLPPGKEALLRHDLNNLTLYDWSRFAVTPPTKGADHYFMHATDNDNDNEAESEENSNDDSSDDETAPVTNPSLATSTVTLTKPSGRAAFQLFSRPIPGMQEISLVDGFLKLYDSNMLGYSTHKDILLRVRGVLIHGIGRVSLVANADPGRSVLVLGDEHDAERSDDTTTDAAALENEVLLEQRRRRLEETLEGLDTRSGVSNPSSSVPVDQIRDDAIALYGSQKEDKEDENIPNKRNIQFKFESFPDFSSLFAGYASKPEQAGTLSGHRRQLTKVAMPEAKESGKKNVAEKLAPPGRIDTLSDVVFPYPFVFDDENGTIRNTKTAAARKMPPREQLLEANAGVCEFEVTMDTKEEQWTLGDWRKLVERRVKEAMNLNPANKPLEAENEDSEDTNGKKGDKDHRLSYPSSSKSIKSSRQHHTRKPIQDEALVMTMVGSITSPNCDFSANLNVTALRTDWEHTTTKAINYSFYMMLTCLLQIMVLLRQLLHTQARSAATRVSLLCIGWQTMIDAMLCLGHIYLSLAIKPLFTAFASVAFFKWLIFCFIEMKYWTLIVQARNSNNGGNTTEQLRRQVAMLHCRFYAALFGAKVLFSCIGEHHRIIFALALYSFWVPQIVQNVITEAKRPLHNWYIYGMSVSRLVAPLYFFAAPQNFLKEVYPESPTDPLMCELLVLWVGIQTAILIGQGKYGARFMIPARFLPPKFDYSRPIPSSLLPPGVSQEEEPELPSRNARKPGVASSSSQEMHPLVPADTLVVRDRRTTARNRIRGSLNRQENSMVSETVVNDTNSDSDCETLDCVICYNSIDVQNRRGYMLAPCDHIFHKDCLVQWMDVKMECPICRTELPSL